MREAQVLFDLIDAALEDDSSLRPEDIVVMAPDLETYAAAFRAVFGQGDGHGIPYEVHDRRTRNDASMYDDFLSVLGLLDSRFSVLDLVRVMDAVSLRTEFRFTQEERSRLTDLLSAAGIRWGIDAAHRKELDFPAEEIHTWRAGLGRLFLGFATAPDATEVFEGLLPRGELSMDDAELVARLARLCEVLFEFQRHTRHPLDVDTWVNQLQRLFASLFAEGDEASAGLHILRAVIDELGELARRGGYTGTVTLKTLRREIGTLLEKRAPAVGFLRRGVTVTEVVPLRSVPFRVVCLVGMSEESFPRADDRASFDFTRSEHALGDRNKRDDDRHSFLQAILCARDRLIITYSTPAARPRRDANPSPVVWELCETAQRYYELPENKPVLEATTHPLHPFDPNYFDTTDLPQSGSERYLEIARALGEPAIDPRRIELSSHAEVTDGEETLSVGELTTWLWNPIAAFIERVLRARFGATELYEPTGALTEIGGLQASQIGNRALRAGLRDVALDAYLTAAPEFPDGNWGELLRRRLAREIGAVNARADALANAREARSRLMTAQLDGLIVEGRLDGLFTDQRVLRRFTKPGRRTELSAWIEHLLMQTAEQRPGNTHLVLRGTETRASLVSFRPVAEPRAQLQELVDLYRSTRIAPLPLLEQSSRSLVEALERGARENAVSAARTQVCKQRERNAYLDYALGPGDPFLDSHWREAFERAARQVYEPLLRHRSEG
ncbi:MAG: hypothetical protein WCE62_01005 [Polyangiales bacterium]